MKKIKTHVVIGAAYGDEGKGLMTDYLCEKILNSGKLPLVVRFNGGAQAGHTVITPGGVRHVFHHFGSGTLLGAETFLGPRVVCNPMLFRDERAALLKLGVTPKVYVSLGCPVTTPYDMILNQFLELQRGGSRHGSCGNGINETVCRQAQQQFSVRDLVFPREAEGKLEHEFSLSRTVYANRIRAHMLSLIETYYRKRFKQLLINEDLCAEASGFFDNETLLDEFVQACVFFVAHTDDRGLGFLKIGYELVFEGAQGLLLDERHPNFPHVTRSSTGMRNVTEIMTNLERDYTTEVYYMHRAYSTRHGAGPFPEEACVSHKIVDETNVPNLFQGTLRFGVLDIQAHKAALLRDSIFLPKDCVVHTVITCVDQVVDTASINFIDAQGQTRNMNGRDYERYLAQHFTYLSYGPTRNTMFPREDLFEVNFRSPVPAKGEADERVTC